MNYTEFKEELNHDVYDKVEEVLSKDYMKLIECIRVWKDVNRYYDTPEPENCNDFYDWSRLIYCTIKNSRYTQHLFNFNL